MTYIVAVLPILLLFTLMLGAKIASWKSALATLGMTIVIACFLLPSLDMLPSGITDKTIFPIVGFSVIEGILKAFFSILLIIIMAIYSYNIMVESGQIEIIKKQFSSLSTDKGILVLIMVWGFGGLLEGMAGFGTAVAIPAAILIGLGFKPFFSALVALLGNTVATGFAAVGVPIITLCKESTANGIVSTKMINEVSSFTIIQLFPLFFLIPFMILMLTDRKGLRKNIILTIWVGGISFIVQFICAYYLGAETPAIIGSLAAIIALIIAARVLKKASQKIDISLKQTFKAWSVYISILLLILVSGTLCPPVNTFLKNHLVTSVKLPYIDGIFTFGWISNAAFMLLLGCIIGGTIQGLSFYRLILVFSRTIVSLKYTMLTIMGLIALASVMNYTGMISTMAQGLVELTRGYYPLFAPLIGAIGTFVTGSDTSSNILFAKLQTNMAQNLGMVGEHSFFGVDGSESNWLLAANTTGATGGKMISPQSIAVASGACEMKNCDNLILKSAIPYAIVYVTIGGLMVYFGN